MRIRRKLPDVRVPSSRERSKSEEVACGRSQRRARVQSPCSGYTGRLHSTTTRSSSLVLSRTLSLALAAVALAACADGGEEDTPQSEVKFTASQHFYGFRSLRGFGSFPVSPNAVFTDRGKLNLFDDSTYTVTRSQGTTAPERYALETTGALSLFVSGSSQEPSVVFLGGYGLVGGVPAATDLYFTDRVTTPSSPAIGLYVGTRVVQGQVELEGDWHIVSMHTIFGQTILSPENVGRTAHGSIDIAAGAPGTSRLISGTGSQSGSTQGPVAITFGGSIQNLLVGGSGDGTCNLTLTYGTDTRIVLAVATGTASTGKLVLGLDAEEDDGEAGLVLMVRKFDAPAGPVAPAFVPGRFLVGGHTLFVNPSNSGSDTFVGVVTLTAPDGFRLEAVGNQGIDFTYVGTYTLAADGGMTISVNGTNETWFAAIDRSYNTLVFVDDFVETRSNNIPELNLGFGVREKTN